jgi:hypothetical protein
MRDDPRDIAERARVIREAGIRARIDGRLAPSLAELNAALGDELGVDAERRRRAAKAPKRFGTRKVRRRP